MVDSIPEDVLEELAQAVIIDAVDRTFKRGGYRILLGSLSVLRDKADELGVELDEDTEIDIQELIEDAIIELDVSWSD